MKSTIPAPAASLLDFIAKYESGGNYLAYYAHAHNLKAFPATIEEVLPWMINRKTPTSSATGRYQIMHATLEGLVKQYKIPTSEAFTSDLQDELGFYLLVERGYDEWIADKLSDLAFANNLSKEWASMPYQTGKSFYDGDGLNHSLVSRSVFMEAIASAKKGTEMVKEAKTATTPTAAAQKVDFIQGLVNTAENFIASIESSVSVAVSPNNSVTVQPAAGSTISGMFSSVLQAQTAVSELGKVIADAKAGNWSNEPQDVLALLQTIFSVLSKFGINVPILSQVIAVLPSLAPVQAPAGTSTAS